MISSSMKETQETNFVCDFCNKTFQREQSVFKHMCESKRRMHEKDKPSNRIAFQCWLRFYQKNTNSRKPKTYLEFTKSAYYIAFVKFGNYCVDINAINIPRYMDWLLENQVKVDTWTSDQVYTRYLIYYLREEDPLDAIARSIETTIDLVEPDNIQAHDCLRYSSKNTICHKITMGKISPWMLYQSESGIEFIESLDEGQQRLIFDYINPEQWALKFLRNKDDVQQVKELLKEAGY
jgi:hypothetical protein